MHLINKPIELFDGRITETVYNVSLKDYELMRLKNAISCEYMSTINCLNDLKTEFSNESDYRIKYLISEKETHLTNLHYLMNSINHILKTVIK